METDWADFKTFPNPTTDKGTDEDSYYCFRVDATTDSKSFTKKLDCLIARAFTEESDKTCCIDCQNKICE